MPDALSMVLRVATSPIWLLWRGYLLLWWAFDDSSERAAARLSAKTTSAAYIPPPKFVDGEDSAEAANRKDARVSKAAKKTAVPLPPPMPVPSGMLKGAFIGTLGLCSFFAILTGGLAASDALSGPRATMLWAWGCAVAACSSVLLVRSVARKRWERPKGPVGRMKDACVGMAKGACASVRERVASIGSMGGSLGKKDIPQAPAEQPAAQATPESAYGAAAFRSAVKNLVPAVARGARGVLHPLRDRASKGFAWAAEKSRVDQSSKAA
ncbi:MAG: hypothetical protein KF691_14345 [Phycisphaeraceae bacterium]|nr:hypothetical protein [Phycisphaeraceae bacterium]